MQYSPLQTKINGTHMHRDNSVDQLQVLPEGVPVPNLKLHGIPKATGPQNKTKKTLTNSSYFLAMDLSGNYILNKTVNPKNQKRKDWYSKDEERGPVVEPIVSTERKCALQTSTKIKLS